VIHEVLTRERKGYQSQRPGPERTPSILPTQAA
jgi:hypothetical protein